MANSIDSLDLYAKIEDMLCNEDAVSSLYAEYLKIIEELDFDSLLDVGCGSGSFLKIIERAFGYGRLKGIDLSPVMVQRARDVGVDAEAIDLCECDGKYSIITAVFDMVNYLDRSALERFGKCVNEHLDRGGYFLCDINTEYGFAEIASGSFTAEDDQRFLVIDSEYDDGIYRSDFTLFERDSEMYRRSDETITQYLYSQYDISSATGLESVSVIPLKLYGEECDKLLLVLRKK